MILPVGDKKWRIRVYVGMRDGKQVYLQETFNGTLHDAGLREAAMKLKADDSPYAPTAQRSFASYADEWLERHKRKIMINTYASYFQYIESAKARLGSMKMCDIEEGHILRYLDDLATGKAGAVIGKKKKCASKSDNTIAKHFWVLRRLFRDALKKNSPMEYMESFKVERKERVIPTDEQAERVFDAVKDDIDMSLIFDLAIWNGMRRGEIFALEWRDIKNGSISITKSLKNVKGGGFVFGPPKSKKSVRTIKVDETTQELIRRKQEKDGTITMSGSIFSFNINQFEDVSKKIFNHVGGGFTFHALRHYCLSKMSEEGFSDAYIAARAGHDENVLRGIYKHIGVSARNVQDDKLMNRRKKAPM